MGVSRSYVLGRVSAICSHAEQRLLFIIPFIVLLLFALPASAVIVNVGGGIPTGMEIEDPVNGLSPGDANKTTDETDVDGTGVAFDWNDILSGAPSTDPYTHSQTLVGIDYTFESYGVVDSVFNTDDTENGAGCVGGDEDGFGMGDKINDNPYTPILVDPLGKGDSCSGAAAVEIVNVITDSGPDAGDEQLHYILYNYWTRTFDATGDMTVFQILRGPQEFNPDTVAPVLGVDPEYRCDDFLVAFNYEPNNGSVTVESLGWKPQGSGAPPYTNAQCAGPGSWETYDSDGDGNPGPDTGGGVGNFGPNVDPVDTGAVGANQGTFGESGIDLTALGLLPEDGPCATFTNEGFITRTGNSQQASTIDLLSFVGNGLEVSNCTDFEVSKTGNAPGVGESFTYLIDQEDGLTVHDDVGGLSATGGGADIDASVNSITSLIGIGDTHVWSGVIAEPDYDLTETVLPADWTMESVVCTYYDPFLQATITDTIFHSDAMVNIDDSGQVAGFVDETDGVGDPDTYIIPPDVANNGIITSCVIHNVTSGLVIEKTIINDNGGTANLGDFDIIVTPQGGLPAEVPWADASLFVGSEQVASQAGEYALQELDLAGYVEGTWECLDDDGGVPLTGGLATGAGVIVGPGQLVTCSITNNDAAPSLIVTKVVNNDFGGTVAPDDFLLTAGGAALTSGVALANPQANTDYLLGETLLAGYSLTGIVCTSDLNGSTNDDDFGTTFPTINLAGGENVSCTITNSALPSDLEVTKTVAGIDASTDWSFEFSLAPAATVGEASPATGTGPGSDIVSWAGLIPGTSYTISETSVAGYTAGALSCNITDTDGDPGNAAVTFVAPLGDGNTATFEVTCAITNTALASDLEVTKTVAGLDASTDWSFEFALAPTATVGEASPATGTGPGSDTVTWTGLIPGTSYTISETTVAGYTAGALTCSEADTDGDLTDATVTFVAPLGDDSTATFEVTCAITNTALGSDLEVTKTVAGIDGTLDWSFEFALAPTATAGEASPATGTGPGSDTVTWTGLIPGTSYTISETTVTGYTAGALTCSEADIDGDLTNATVTFVAPLGDDNTATFEVTCAITNTALASDLEVTKTVAGIDASTDWSFEFALAPTATVGEASPATGTGPGSDTVTWTGLIPGTSYTISETTVAGYTAGALTCSEADTDGDLTDATVTFVAPLGDDSTATFEVTCAITNTALGSDLEVTKTVAGIDGTLDWSFEFALAPTATAGEASPATGTGPGSDTVTWTGLIPGTSYTISETTVTGYTAGALTCSEADIDGDLTNATVTFVAPLGDDNTATFEVTCAITNTALASDLEVTKTVAGIDASTDWSFEFALAPTATVGEASPATGTGPGSDTVTWTGLIPGTSYTISETTVAGYTAGALTCSEADTDGDLTDATVTFVAPLGDDSTATFEVTCAITNTALASDIEVTKTVEGIDANLDWSFEFSLTPLVTAVELSPATGTGPGSDTVTWIGMTPGESYTVSETSVTGYTAGALTCNVPDTDGDITDTSVTFVAPVGDDNTSTFEVTCAITNTALASDLEVTKTVAGIDASTDWSFEFALAPAATAVETSPTTGTGAGSDTVTWSGLVPGTSYTISETTVAGYTAGALTCSEADTDGDLTDASVTFVAPLGDANDPEVTFEVTCAITNTALASDLEVTKTVAGIDATLDWSFEFVLAPAATPGEASPATGTGPGSDTVTWTGLVPGTSYTISETTVAGYTAGALTCSEADTDGDLSDATVTFVAPLGDANDPEVTFEVTCAITNTALASDLEITKTVAGIDDITGWSFEFTLAPAATIGEASPATGTGAGSDTVTWSGLVPGTSYTISETTVAGYTAGALTCSEADTDGDLTDASVTFIAPLGDANDPDVTFEVTCAITNTAQGSDLEVTKTVEGVDATLDWSFEFTLAPAATPGEASPATGAGPGSDTVTWTGLLPGTSYTISETTVAGYAAGALTCSEADTDGDLTDASVTFVAPLGDANDPEVTFEVTCAITNTALASDLEVTKTVAGIDAGLDWSFEFALAPAATAGEASPATGTGSGTDTVTWTGLVPGTSYTISETTIAGYTAGALTCSEADTDGDLTDASVTFVAPLGDTNDPNVTFEVTCAITNTALASDLEVVKTVETNSTIPWSFDFELMPAATTGETSPATGTGAGSDTVTWTGLVPGASYTISETESAGYTGGALTCNVVDTDQNPDDLSVTFVAPIGDANDPEVTFEVMCSITNQQWPDLIVTKSVDPAAVADGSNLVFSILVSNQGVLPATAVVLSDLLPTGLAYVSDSPTQGIYDSDAGVWTVGAIAGGSSATLTLTVMMDAAAAQCSANYLNTATITGQGELDFDTTNHSDSASASLVAIALAKELDSAPTAISDGELGDSWLVTYNLLVVNTGGVELTGVQIVEDLNAIIDIPNDNDATIDPSKVTAVSGDLSLTPNPNYDGVNDTNVLSGADSLLPGSEGRITVTFELKPDVYFGPFDNQASASGTGEGVTVTDLSEDGASVTTTAQQNRTFVVVDVSEGCVVDSPTSFQLSIPSTPITLGWIKASDQGSSVLFEWHTESEIANAGFYLQGQSVDGQWVNLNEDMIAGQGDSVALQTYSYEAATNATVFRLVDVSISGVRKTHGEFKVGSENGLQSPRKATDWTDIERESDAKRQQRDEEIRRELQRMINSGDTSGVQLQETDSDSLASRLGSWAGGALAFVLNAMVPQAHAIDIAALEIDKPGIYQVSYADLAALGLDLSGQAISGLSVKAYGEPVRVKVISNGSEFFGPGAAIRFAADTWPNKYTINNTYTLAIGEGQALIQADDGDVPSGKAATSYMAERSYAPQNVYSHTSPSKTDSWYADKLKAISGPASKNLSIDVDGYFPVTASSSSGSSAGQQALEKPSLNIKLWGASNLNGHGVHNPDHHVTANLNGQRVADIRFDGLSEKVVSQTLSSIKNGSNSLDIELPKDHGYAFDLVNLDQVSLRYPRRFYAEDAGTNLVFDSAWSKFRVRRLANDDLEVFRQEVDGVVYDVSERELNGCATGAGSCIVAFKGGSEEAFSRYYVSTKANIRTPAMSLVGSPQDLFAGSAKYLIIAHNDFIANPLLQSYLSDLQVQYGSADIVDVASIYGTYTGFEKDARAIHAYIKDAHAQRGTEHVLLVGGDMYDYHNNLNTNARSFIPSIYVQIALNVNAVPSDAMYADVDDDLIPDLGMSRLPVRSTAELNRILNKRTQYLARDYTDTAVFAADKVDGSGYSFKADAQSAISSSFGNWQVAQAYLDDAELSIAKSNLIQQINAGSALTSYFGHSSTDRWSISGLLTGEEVAALQNTNKPTVVAQWGCWNTFYVSPTEDSIAHRFLVENNQGAVTVMGASSLTNAEAEREMSVILYQHLKQGKSISQAVLDAKRELAISRPHQLDVLLGWAVLGAADMAVVQ